MYAQKMALAARLVGCLLVLALITLTAAMQGKKIFSEWEQLTALAGQEPLAEFERSVASLRGDLPSRGHVHFVTEPANGDWTFLVYLLAQNALAPLILDRGSVPGPSLVLTLTAPQLDTLVLRHKWRVLRRAAPNIALVDTLEPEKAEEHSADAGDAPR